MASDVEEIKEDLVRQLANVLDETNLSEIEYDTGGLRIRIARQVQGVVATAPQSVSAIDQAASAAAPSSSQKSEVNDPASHPGAVKAPMVGVAYLAADPDSPPYVKVGDTVSEGQTLMLIEAMKTFNPVRASRPGTVSAILVTDGQPIEFDQPLIIVD